MKDDFDIGALKLMVKPPTVDAVLKRMQNIRENFGLNGQSPQVVPAASKKETDWNFQPANV